MPETSAPARDWVPGCGDERLAGVVARAAAGVPAKDLFWIGCSAGLGSLKCYGYHAPHGHGLALAIGAKLANPGLTVLVSAETGLSRTPALAHVVDAARRGLDLACLADEAAPLAGGPAQLALEAGAGFVARVSAGDEAELERLIALALAYPGFALIERVAGSGLPLGLLRQEPAALQRRPTRAPAASQDLTPSQREELLAALQ